MDTKPTDGKRVWTFESHDKVKVYVSIEPKDNFYFLSITADGAFKAAQGAKSLESLLLFTGQQLHRIRSEGLLSLDGESFLHRCMEDIKL